MQKGGRDRPFCSGFPWFAPFSHLDSSESADGFLQRMKLFDDGIHRVFLEIHLLSKGENLFGFGAWYNDNAIRIRSHDVAWLDLHTVT